MCGKRPLGVCRTRCCLLLSPREERRLSPLVLAHAAVATDGEAADEDARKDGHEVADIHGHDGQHAVSESVSYFGSDKHRNRTGEKTGEQQRTAGIRRPQ